MGLVQYGHQLVEARYVYYAGSTQLQKGQPLCYEPLDDGNVNAPAGDKDRKTWLGQRANLPDAANINRFAGIIHPDYEGVDSEGWVMVLVPKPGEFVEVRVDGTTDIAVDDSLELDPSKQVFIKDATVAAGVFPRARAEEAYSTDDSNGVIWAYFY